MQIHAQHDIQSVFPLAKVCGRPQSHLSKLLVLGDGSHQQNVLNVRADVKIKNHVVFVSVKKAA